MTVTVALAGLGLAKRWLVTVIVALVLFGGCWLGLAAANWKDTPTQVGVSSVLLAVLLAALGAWAQQAKPNKAGPNLRAGKKLRTGRSLYSSDGSYRLDMQEDGNLVLRNVNNRRVATWASNTAQTGNNNYLKMQKDGNLVVYTGKNEPVWQSKTAGKGGKLVTVQNDGNLVIYAPGGQGVWASRFGRVIGALEALRDRPKSPPEDGTLEEPNL